MRQRTRQADHGALGLEETLDEINLINAKVVLLISVAACAIMKI